RYRWAAESYQPALPVNLIYRQRAAPAAADHQTLPPIAFQVAPRHTRPQLAQLVHQQWLSQRIVERPFVVRVAEQLTHVLEEGLVVGCSMFDVRCSMFDGGFDLRSGLVHFVNPDGPDPFDNAALPSPPLHLDPHVIGP